MLFLKNTPSASPTDRAALRRSLQVAIELEHSTIPPYLYALYSLRPGQNEEIGKLILSVVWEEMVHMSLACNILNAIGGAPSIDRSDFIPKYPGHLPGTVEDALVVHLAPFSPHLLKETFMVIEEPETPNHYPVQPTKLLATEQRKLTIGEFYTGIKEALKACAADPGQPPLFVADHSRQLDSWHIPKVTDLKSALKAIDIIIDQGEGTTHSPMTRGLDGPEPAHYYRFAEIYYGYQLVPSTDKAAPGYDQGYAYQGAPIVYAPAGVWPVIEDPKSSTYAANSAAQFACQTFNYTYTSLLKGLHQTFNGDPGYINTTIGIMESLKGQARALMATPLVPGGLVNAGPSFEYQPSLPLQFPGAAATPSAA